MKFGGTSVHNPEAREQAVHRIRTQVEAGYDVCVVVSAMGRKGEPYATDTLLKLVRDVHDEVGAQELDLACACGEILSSVVMTATLCRAGLKAVSFTGWQAGIVTDGRFGDARIRRVQPDLVLEPLSEGKVAVVAGFQGRTERGEVTTLGRGGSDISAVALGVGIGAELVEIYTDVDGVKAADPNMVPGASTIPVITYEELCQLAHEGARVVHPVAAELAMRNGLALRIRSTFDDGPGTLVTGGDVELEPPPFGVPLRPVTAVTTMPDMAHVEVDFPPYWDSSDELRLFRLLAQEQISLDMILVTPFKKAFIVTAEKCQTTRITLQEAGFTVRITPECAKVTVVGGGMRGVPGVMASVASALHGADIDIIQTADSHMSISCLIRQWHMEDAVRALYRNFYLGD